MFVLIYPMHIEVVGIFYGFTKGKFIGWFMKFKRNPLELISKRRLEYLNVFTLEFELHVENNMSIVVAVTIRFALLNLKSTAVWVATYEMKYHF